MDTTFLEQGGLLETLSDHFDIENTSSIDNWMEVEMDLTNESTMSLFQELEEVEEVQEATTDPALLSNLISQCGIPVEQEVTTFPCSPANSMNSDMETHQSLIEELEDFFGSPTNIESEEGSRGLDLVTKTSMTAKSPDHSNIYASDTDPEWVPSPSSSVNPSSPLRTISTESRAVKKKYQRKKPPTPPVGPYPVEKRERKKAQNRSAAFRYREKKKGEQNTVEDELELLSSKNVQLRAKLTEMETEARLLKKWMTEAGLGRIASTMSM